MNEKMLVFQIFQVLMLTVVTTLAVKNLDDHPYEFGFTIDGQQHRHEKKDDKGIIQGEFGFITADGIYHVTVYATDENGDFKILSMRNLRISAPLDGSPFKGEISPEANKYRKQANLAPLPQPNPLSLPENGVSNTKEEEKLTIQSSVPEIASTTEKVNKFTTQSTIRPACASCGLISTPKPQPVQPFVYQNTANGQIANVNQPTVKENGHQPIGSGGPSITNLPPAYQAVSGPQSTNYNTFGSQEHNKQPEIGSLQNSLVNLGVGASNTQSDNNRKQEPAGGDISNLGVGVNEYQGQAPVNMENEQESPGSQLGNTNGQYSNVGGNPTNSGLGDYNQQGHTPVNVENGQEGNSGPSGPYTNNASPGGGLSNGGLGFNIQEQLPNVQVSNGQSGNVGPANQQGNIQSGLGLGPAGQTDAPEPNPLQLPVGGQGANAPSTLPPISVSDGFIHVGGDKKQDIPIKDKFPGMEDGLPDGIDEKDITNLLYKFHYTVGFHGHYEKGLKNGAKIGGYFVNGRDGISRVVTYIADENGYRPKVKFINLGLESDDTPKPETEKTFGLKSFEFVWYPL